MKLYIIRHGETAWNKELFLQGQTDIPLNENGRELAQVTARALQMVPFDLCITSPLLRAKETAQIILGNRTIPFLEDARIQEIGFGTYEGRRVRDESGALVDPIFQSFFSHPDQFIPPKDAESLPQLLARTAAFLDELAQKSSPTKQFSFRRTVRQAAPCWRTSGTLLWSTSGMEGFHRTVPSQSSNFFRAQRKATKQMPLAGQS